MRFLFKLTADQRGTAALEFALTGPLVLFLIFGSIDVATFLVNVDRARRAAVEAGDILSQWQPSDGVVAADGSTHVLGPNGMTNILNAVGGIEPVSTGANYGLILTLVRECTATEVSGGTCPNTSVPVYIQGQAATAKPSGFTSMLGSTENGTPTGYVAASGGTTATVQNVPISAGDQVIFVEVRYTFQPFIFAALGGGPFWFNETRSMLTVNDFAAFRSRQPIYYCDSTTSATLGPCSNS